MPRNRFTLFAFYVKSGEGNCRAISSSAISRRSCRAIVFALRLSAFGAFEMVFSTGVFVGGIHEADNKQAAEKAAEVLIGRLKEIND